MAAWARLHAVLFHGNKAARDALVRFEWAVPPPGCRWPSHEPTGKQGAPLGWCGTPRFDVCITSYEMLVACAEIFRSVERWAYVVVDEASLRRRRGSLTARGEERAHAP